MSSWPSTQLQMFVHCTTVRIALYGKKNLNNHSDIVEPLWNSNLLFHYSQLIMCAKHWLSPKTNLYKEIKMQLTVKQSINRPLCKLRRTATFFWNYSIISENVGNNW